MNTKLKNLTPQTIENIKCGECFRFPESLEILLKCYDNLAQVTPEQVLCINLKTGRSYIYQKSLIAIPINGSFIEE